jgi:predicted transcriptional regulator
MKLEKIVEILEGDIICNTFNGEIDISTACGADLMSDVLSYFESGLLLLTGLNMPQAVRAAEMADIKAIVFVRGKSIDKNTLELAKEKKIPLVATGLSMFEACGRLYQQGLKGLPNACMIKYDK